MSHSTSQRIPKVLALDDDQSWLDQVPMILEDECQVDCLPSIDQGLMAVDSQFYDIVLLDLNFEGDTRSGLDVFRRIHALDRGADIIVISGETNRERLADIFNAGVTKFIPKPATPDQIREAVRATLDSRALKQRAIDLATSSESSPGRNPLIGGSLAMQKLRAEISRVIASGCKDVLVAGPTGTGKELIARAIAYGSDPSRRFIPIHCGAIADTLVESELFGHVKGAFTGAASDRIGPFEAAGGGFVFLDEIGEMPLPQQAKLLRVIQERAVTRVGSFEERKANFRLIAATNADLDKSVMGGKFREDLYFRIARETITVPSLKDRIEDVPELVHFFLAITPAAQRKGITDEAIALLQTHSWPGNVRELEGVVGQLQSRCKDGVIREKDVCQVLPQVDAIMSSRLTKSFVGRYGVSLIAAERRRFEKAIIQTNGDRAAAAQMLGMSRATFFRKAKDLGLVKERVLRTGTVGVGA